MNRKFIIGKSYEEAMLQNLEDQDLSHRDKLNWIDEIPIIPNPLNLGSADLELRLFTYLHAKNCKSVRKLTQTEEASEKFIQRLYGEQVDIILQDIFAIEFTPQDLLDFQTKIIKANLNPNILKNKKVWRILLLQDIEEYEINKKMDNLNFGPSLNTMFNDMSI
tara:strand:- start:396 stop:887 length:492 start_codon:yes stop_codon:yes gene_type:complete